MNEWRDANMGQSGLEIFISRDRCITEARNRQIAELNEMTCMISRDEYVASVDLFLALTWAVTIIGSDPDFADCEAVYCFMSAILSSLTLDLSELRKHAAWEKLVCFTEDFDKKLVVDDENDPYSGSSHNNDVVHCSENPGIATPGE